MASAELKSFQGEIPINELYNDICVYEVIALKVQPEAEWISDIVKKVDKNNNILEIKLLDEFINQNLMVDDVVNCRYIKEDIEYVIEAKIIDIGIIHPQTVMLELQKALKYDNARNSKRYTVNLCGRVTYNEGENGAFATIKNISRTGISLICRECIGINTEVDIEIVLWQKEVMAIEGRVVTLMKAGKNYRYGIVIENIEQKSKELMEDFINELEQNEKCRC